MPEKLVVQEAFGERHTVDLYHGLRAAQGGGVNIVGEDFLARAALSADQYRQVRHRQLFHLVPEGDHGGVAGNDCRGQLTEPAFEIGVLLLEPGKLEGLLHCHEELVEIHGLLHVVESAELEGEYRGFHRGEGRDHDNRHGLVHCLQPLQHVDAAFFTQHDVEENDVDPARRERGERLLAAGCDHRAIAQVLEILRQAFADLHVIVDDEDACSHF